MPDLNYTLNDLITIFSLKDPNLDGVEVAEDHLILTQIISKELVIESFRAQGYQATDVTFRKKEKSLTVHLANPDEAIAAIVPQSK